MTNFEKTRLTNKGIHLAATKGIEVTFTRVETGSGIYSVDEDVGDQEALKEKKQDYTINSIKKEEDDQISLKFCMSNETLQQTYLFTEIGVYALDQDGNEILYAICFSTPENAQKFVAYDGRFISSMFITLLFELSSESTAVFDVSGAYVTYEDLQELAEDVKASIEDTKDSKVTFTSNDTLAPTEFSEMPSVLASKETHASLFSKISTVFKNMRYIIGLLGSTDISQETLGIGDSTVTGAIKGLNESLAKDSLNNLLFKAIDVDSIDKEDKYNVDTLPYGVYYITKDKSINGPSGEEWMFYVTIANYAGKPGIQIAFPIGSTKMYFRTYSSMWLPWRAVSAT